MTEGEAFRCVRLVGVKQEEEREWEEIAGTVEGYYSAKSSDHVHV